MSGIEVIGPEEARLVEDSERFLKREIFKYFQSHWIGTHEYIELGDFITGMEKSEARGAGYFSTTYILNAEFELRARERRTLLGLGDWVRTMTARLGDSHGLSKHLHAHFLTSLGDKAQLIEVERLELIDKASEQAERASMVLKRIEAQQLSKERQLREAEERVHTVSAQKDSEIEELRAEIGTLNDQIAELTSAASGQAQSLRQLTSMASLDEAVHMTEQAFMVLQGVLDQLTLVDTATQVVRQEKDSTVRQVEQARGSLTNLTSEEWLTTAYSACPTNRHRNVQMTRAYVHKATAASLSVANLAMANSARDVLFDVCADLGKYEKTLSGQFCKKTRAGYKRKRPIVNSLVQAIRDQSANINDDGSNARALLVSCLRLVNAQRHKQDGSEKRNYRTGENFKIHLDDAFLRLDRALDGRIVYVNPVQSDAPIQMDLVEGVDTPEALCDRQIIENRIALLGPQGLPAAIAAETSRAVDCLSRASAGLAAMGSAADNASNVRERCLERMNSSFDERRTVSRGVGGVVDVMNRAQGVVQSVRSRLTEQRLSPPLASAPSGPIPIADAVVPVAPSSSLVLAAIPARRRSASLSEPRSSHV